MGDPETESLAEELGVYTESGEPDVERASRIMQRIDARSERVASDQLNRSTTLARDAQDLRAQAHTIKDDQGQTYADPEVLNTLLDDLPVELQANKKVVGVIMTMARGIASARSPKERAAATAAAHSYLEKRAMEARNISPEQWRKYTEDESDVLESDDRVTMRGLSAMEQKAAQMREMSEDQWRKNVDNKSDVLEE